MSIHPKQPMVTKDELHHLKQTNLPALYRTLRESQNQREILFILKHLGRLPAAFDGTVLFPFVQNPNDTIRLWAVKNMGKIPHPQTIDRLVAVINSDTNSLVRREAVSSIGRMRLPQAQPILTVLLQDSDPKVVLQAIRGLLVFKRDNAVSEVLANLAHHPNETIQTVIHRELPATHVPPAPQCQTNPRPHPASPMLLHNTVVHGDVREILPAIPTESIHLTFTSPPYYNARDYAIYESYNAYLDFLTNVFQQIHRITKEGRFLIVNTSPVIIPRVSRAYASKRYPIPFDLHTRLVNNGWEFIDDIVWLKPESSVKNRNAGFLQHRKPLGYKPNTTTEYVMVYRKETDKLLDWNMRQYEAEIVERSRVQGAYETSNVWRIDPTSDRVHSAVFPLELCHRVIMLYSYLGDLVFDPFGGSGTLGKAARNLERKFLLTEQDGAYVEKMKAELGNLDLTGHPATRFLDAATFIAIGKDTETTRYATP